MLSHTMQHSKMRANALNWKTIAKSPFFLLEDWWAVWLGFLFIFLIISGIIPSVPAVESWAQNPLQAFSPTQLVWLLAWGLSLLAIWTLALKNMGEKLTNFIRGFPTVFVLALLAFVIGENDFIGQMGFGYVIWAVIIGLLISNLTGVPAWLKSAAKTELYIKTGLVLLGAEILFQRLVVFGVYGMGVAWLVTPTVLLLMYFWGRNIVKGLSSTLGITIAAATSVCGVSAAIATASACRAKKDELTLALAITMIFTAGMMFLLPLIVQFTGMGPLVGGAWIGGTIDATGAVVAAASLLGEDALHIAATIKMVQNVLIGIIAFAVAVAWSMDEKESEQENQQKNERKPVLVKRYKEIWNRLPKFILGFVAASLLFSFVLLPAQGEAVVSEHLSLLSSSRNWLFALAFVSIGLETNFVSLKKLLQGGKPVTFYVLGQFINLVLTLGAAYLFFSGRFFGLPL